MSEAVLKFFMYNGEFHEVKEFENIYVEENPSIYEVIRIIDGVPLFLEEHYERLIYSSRLMENPATISLNEILESMLKMIETNNISNYNIKIVLNNLKSEKLNVYYFFIASHYPDSEMYRSGVKTVLYRAERSNPNAKVINKGLRRETDQILKEKSAYEALLVNNQEEITEGSRSNLFFIKSGTVFTASEKDVLSGITRKRIINLCEKNSIKVLEVPIRVEDLDSFEAAFISGTSPKVLPISSIDSTKLDVSNHILKKIMQSYDKEIEDYIRKSK